MGRRIASESKQTVRGGPKPAKVGLHRRLVAYMKVAVWTTFRMSMIPFLFKLCSYELGGRGRQSLFCQCSITFSLLY
jgi:hypothetical protein